DWQSKVAVIYLGALFPMIINTMAGVRNTDAALLRVARSFGASETLVFRRVVLPGAVPFILTGLRLGVGHALTGVVVAELVAACGGQPASTATPTTAATQAQGTASGPADKPMACCKKVVAAYSNISADDWVMWYAFEKGIFKERGLDVDMQSISGGAQTSA